jgi:hypothetical protein
MSPFVLLVLPSLLIFLVAAVLIILMVEHWQ